MRKAMSRRIRTYPISPSPVLRGRASWVLGWLLGTAIPLTVKHIALVALLAAMSSAGAAIGETIIVAARDSSPQSQAAARFIADGEGDQEEINAAIHALAPEGGTVRLMAGTYDIRRVGDKLGGVIIDRSHVTLAGEGAATQLVQAENQNVNVIRIIGSGVGHVTIRDLYVDANREQNQEGTGDSNISHDRFEFCGIKAFRQAPRGPSAAEDTHDITIRNCIVKNSHRLGIMLEGPNMRVLDNLLGNAGSDSVEILTGPGIIRGNVVEITGRTHVAIGTDRANSIIMSDNIVHVAEGGSLDIGFRSWAGSKRHSIANNVLTVDKSGGCALAMDVRGTETTITGNNIYTSDPASPTRLRISAGNAVVSANVFENVVIEVDDATSDALPILLESNIMKNTEVIVREENVRQPDRDKSNDDASD